MLKGRVMSYRLGGHDRGPVQHLPQPVQAEPEQGAALPEAEPVADDPDIDQLDDDAETEDYFAEADALAAMSPEEFHSHLRAQVDRVASGEIPGGLEVVHPGPKDRPRSRHYKRRDRYGRAF